MSEFIEFSGKSTEEALHKAQTHFDLPLGRLEVEVVSTGSSGLFGLLGAKKAKVRVRPLAGNGLEADLAELAAVVSDGHRPRGGRSLEERAVAQPAPKQAFTPAASEAAAPKPAPTPAPAPVAAATAPQPAPAKVVEAPAPAPSAAAPVVAPAPVIKPAAPAPASEEIDELETAEAFDSEVEGDLGEDEAGLASETEEESAPGGDQRLEQDPEVIAHAREVLTRLVSYLDESASVEAQGGGQGIELAVQSQDVGVLIGRRGQNLEALQYLVTRIVSHRCGRPVRVVVDAGEYRRRRREALEDLARRMAQKARQSGRAVAVGPLSAQERRVVHLTLKGEAGLTTSSRGRGELKKVIIAPSRSGGGTPATGQ